MRDRENSARTQNKGIEDSILEDTSNDEDISQKREVTVEDVLQRRDELLGIAEERRVSRKTAINQYGRKRGINAQNEQLNARKVFLDDKDFIITFEHYINKIQENDYSELPTLLNFAKFVKCSPHTIQGYLYRLSEEDRKLYKAVLADMLYQGVNAGAYDKQMTIFAMKNLCDWSDRVESTSKIEKKKEIISKEEADKLIKEYVSSLEEC